MSFQDVRHKPSSSSAAKNQSESQAVAVAAALFQVNTAVATFRRLVDAIGTSKDTPDHRLKLQNTRQRILELVKDASAKLKSLTESDAGHDVDVICHILSLLLHHAEKLSLIEPNRRVQDAKLAKDFQTTLQEFQKMQQLASERESRFSPVVPLPPSITISSSDQYTEPSSETEDESFLMEHKRQEVLLLNNDVAFNEAVIDEREQGIEEIEGQVREVNDIFKDLAVLVHEQSVTIDDIEHNIEAPAVAMTQAKLLLSKGSKSGKSKASWCWWVLAILVVILVILLLIIIL